METRELRRQIEYEFLEMTLLLIKKVSVTPMTRETLNLLKQCANVSNLFTIIQFIEKITAFKIFLQITL